MSEAGYLASVRERSRPLFGMAADAISGRAVPRREDGAQGAIAGRYDLALRPGEPPGPVDVSVVIPTYRRPRLLPQAVESVARAARDISLEIVVVNDDPERLPDDVVARLLASAAPVSLAQHHRNLGLGAARNTGASLARGKFLLMLDDDDTLVDGGLTALLDAARADQAPFYFGDHVRQWYDEERPAGSERRSVGREALTELATENLIVCGSFMILRETFLRLDGYREDLPVHEDYNLHIRALSGARAVYVESPISVYHCRRSLPRLNDRRLFWFATCAFNHAVYRELFGRRADEGLKLAQREYQYAHLVRALAEGCPAEAARSVVDLWWSVLGSRGLSAEIATEREIISRLCPAVA